MERRSGLGRLRAGWQLPSWVRSLLLVLWIPMMLVFTTIAVLAPVEFVTDPSWGNLLLLLVVEAFVGPPLLRQVKRLRVVVQDLSRRLAREGEAGGR